MQKVSRRHVIATLSASSVMLCPALLNAQAQIDWPDSVADNKPIGEDRLITLASANEPVDVSDLQPGEVAVIARANDGPDFSNTDQTQYVAVLRRTDDQIAAANDRDGTVQDERYFVANLVCPHRGYAIGMTGDASIPFACTRRGGRHGSEFDAAGLGVAGASDGEYMSIPAYTLDASGVITLS
ncbi:MAG: hypothetical protein AAFO58_01235 [Pseudomonadota bacterium]